MYGSDTLEEIEDYLKESFPEEELVFFQSNKEGELVEAIQSLLKSDVKGVVANFGGYSHSSVAIRDALALLEIPYVEVHLSNIHAREEFRRKTITGSVAEGIVTGFGKESYALGIRAIKKLVTRNK
jgi:3-dehydroquinate dehydratase-2